MNADQILNGRHDEPEYTQVELHLNPMPLKRSHAKRIKACGGKYKACRSVYDRTRYVVVPVAERELINDLVVSYPHGKSTTMIARFDGLSRWFLPSWVIVQNVDPRTGDAPLKQFERKYNAAVEQASRRGLLRERQG
jgi:hypothetical protein